MAQILSCDIVTPERQLFSADSTFVAAPAIDGEMGVLPGHVPMVALLGSGEVRVTLAEGGEVEHFAISGGYIQVQGDNKVIVLADRAVNLNDVDIDVAKGDVGELAVKIDQLPEDAPNRGFLKKEYDWACQQVELKTR